MILKVNLILSKSKIDNKINILQKLEHRVIDLSSIIGSIADSNSHFTDGLVRFIEKIGKPLPELTVTELVTIIQEYREAYNAGAAPAVKKISVSPIKHQSLKKQHEIIGHSLAIFENISTQNNRLTAAQDTIELVRMLQDITNDLSRNSRFNVYVLNKAKKLIAERVSFDQALQYENCVIKFACMEVA